MPRYGDLDEAIKHLRGNCMAKYPLSYSNGISAAIKEIGKLPAADVVPRADVDSEIKVWQELYADTVDMWEKAYEELENAKSEVVRKIFEEIDRAVEKAEIEWDAVFGIKLCIAELRRKFEERSE